MHITKVVIEGFKSFKEQTIFEFLPGLNFVVGQDEAGKSNLLYAIQFALTGHQFQQLTQTNLVKLLYSSSAGVRVKSAYVEIIIDNQDKSIREEGGEIRLRRIITSSKDAYTINGHSTSVEKVMKTLQSKLSKANPYYIMSHKKTQEICTSPNKKCWAILCDIAGCLQDLKSEEESMREKDSSINYDEIKIRKKTLEKELETDRAYKQEVLKKIRATEGRLESIRSSFKQIKMNFCQVASEDVLQGMESVWTVVNQMKKEEEFKDLAREYRGLVIEHFECPTRLMVLADAIAKNRLFQHVVDTDRASTEIKKRMAEKKLPGCANFIINTLSDWPEVFEANLACEQNEIVYSHDIVEGVFNKFFICPTNNKSIWEWSQGGGVTCATLDGQVNHAPDDIPDGLSFPNLTRFQILADYKEAKGKENIQKSQLAEQKKLLKEIDSRIKTKEAEHQQIKTNIAFQTEHKTTQGSLKSLEAEISSLREWIKSEKQELILGPIFSLQELKHLMKELILLKGNEKDLCLSAENLKKVHCLNKKLPKIGFAVESLRKQWQKTHRGDVKIPQISVCNQRPNMTNINQELSLLKTEIEDAVLLVDRSPFYLLNQSDGFSLHSQFIVTTLVPGLLQYADSNIFGLRFDDATQLSRVFKVSKKEARQYLDQPQEN